MYGHERSLVSEYEGRPFALLGYNSDDPADIGKIYEDNNITWRTWVHDGGTGGPVPSEWGITTWPTIILIDHNGVIQYRGHEGNIDTEIEELVAKAEREL